MLSKVSKFNGQASLVFPKGIPYDRNDHRQQFSGKMVHEDPIPYR